MEEIFEKPQTLCIKHNYPLEEDFCYRCNEEDIYEAELELERANSKYFDPEIETNIQRRIFQYFTGEFK